MLKMTQSIPKLEETKPNINLTCIAHHTRGKRCTYGSIVNQSPTLEGIIIKTYETPFMRIY
jgi:hypothetical protein